VSVVFELFLLSWKLALGLAALPPSDERRGLLKPASCDDDIFCCGLLETDGGGAGTARIEHL
jgi:hypothetical protein